ncbi:MAG: hypothetical protein ABEJ03_04785 [Candidatus Nanohaloarchaea archaeon]
MTNLIEKYRERSGYLPPEQVMEETDIGQSELLEYFRRELNGTEALDFALKAVEETARPSLNHQTRLEKIRRVSAKLIVYKRRLETYKEVNGDELGAGREEGK